MYKAYLKTKSQYDDPEDNFIFFTDKEAEILIEAIHNNGIFSSSRLGKTFTNPRFQFDVIEKLTLKGDLFYIDYTQLKNSPEYLEYQNNPKHKDGILLLDFNFILKGYTDRGYNELYYIRDFRATDMQANDEKFQQFHAQDKIRYPKLVDKILRCLIPIDDYYVKLPL